jgi:hypothetical protein
MLIYIYYRGDTGVLRHPKLEQTTAEIWANTNRGCFKKIYQSCYALILAINANVEIEARQEESHDKWKIKLN